MKTFLENICEDILAKHGEMVSDLCFVFPSRRAGIFFKNILSKKNNSPIWSPSVFSIEDFIEKISGLNFADNLELLFELYSVYTRVIENENIKLDSGNGVVETAGEDESFDSFYPWGEMLLNDFDVIDKYLVNTNLLFRRINDLKEIEEAFPVELQDTFKKFWGTLFDTNQTFAKKNFLKIWQVLGSVYTEFTTGLKAKNKSYPGLAYRKLNEALEESLYGLQWKKIIFAGFNSLNPVELKLMKMLSDKGIAEIYWDADDYYISDKNQEAGNFIRKNLKVFGKDEIPFKKNIINNEKNINVIGTSSFAGMAKALGNELKKSASNENFNPEKTAVVLPDEKLLLPVLYSIPDEIEKINVTMGFPFGETPLYSLIELLIGLQENYIYEKGKYKFHYSSVEKILLHPYIKFQNTSVIYDLLNEIKKKNIVYSDIISLTPEIPPILKIIFDIVENPDGAKNYFSQIIDIITSRIENDESKETNYKKFQFEYLFHFYTNFNKLNDLILSTGLNINIATYWKMLKEVLGKTSIPFTGEPLQGLQIMGLLETRSLDFENVYILSVNEGVLPQEQKQNSFIPYTLRKAFAMPTYEESDSVTAYNFYRLMQKAKNVFLIYNTDIGQDVKEKSRYILQIENELVPGNKNINYTNKILIPGLYGIEKKSIEIQKNNEVLDKLKSLKHFSPSALVKYINCSLQFYFEKIAGIKEEEKIEETFSPVTIGSVLHKILEKIYGKSKGKLVTEDSIEEIISYVSENFRSILESAVKEYKLEYLLEDYGGKNYLFGDIIFKLLMRVLENDKKNVPFKILDLEIDINDKIKINVNGSDIEIPLNGRIDRIEEKNNIVRIIDYKTGGFEYKKYIESNPAEYFEKLITNPDYKENFQALFYSYFYSKENPNKKINVGLYPIKKIQDGINELKKENIENEEFDMFESVLKKLFSEMFNPGVPFRQVEDEKRCSYCPYSQLCYRDLKNTI